MSITVNACDRQQWHRLRLADCGDFIDGATDCRMGLDNFVPFGEWFLIPDEPLPNGDRVIYFGSWSNANCASDTCAEIFNMNDPDDAAAFDKKALYWRSQPEYLVE